MRRPDDERAVILGNPASEEYEIARTSLMPGILKTVNHNRQHTVPMKLFEISDVCLLDPAMDVGARNERHIAAIYADTSVSFEDIHGLLDAILLQLGIYSKYDKQHPNAKHTYDLKPTDGKEEEEEKKK